MSDHKSSKECEKLASKADIFASRPSTELPLQQSSKQSTQPHQQETPTEQTQPDDMDDPDVEDAVFAATASTLCQLTCDGDHDIGDCLVSFWGYYKRDRMADVEYYKKDGRRSFRSPGACPGSH